MIQATTILAAHNGISKIPVFGYSLIVVKWMNVQKRMKNLVPSPIFDEITVL